MRQDLNTGLWKRLRLFVKTRDNYRCTKCGKSGILEVDHKTPVKYGGAKYDVSNLQTLCKRCHLDKTRSEMNTIIPNGLDQWIEYLTKTKKAQ